MFRALAILCLVAASAATARAGEAPPRACLSDGDAADVVASRKVVTPADAIVAARHAVPDGHILRASLCGRSDALVYRLTAIRSDGRVVRVTIDAPSGKVEIVR